MANRGWSIQDWRLRPGGCHRTLEAAHPGDDGGHSLLTCHLGRPWAARLTPTLWEPCSTTRSRAPCPSWETTRWASSASTSTLLWPGLGHAAAGLSMSEPISRLFGDAPSAGHLAAHWLPSKRTRLLMSRSRKHGTCRHKNPVSGSYRLTTEPKAAPKLEQPSLPANILDLFTNRIRLTILLSYSG